MQRSPEADAMQLGQRNVDERFDRTGLVDMQPSLCFCFLAVAVLVVAIAIVVVIDIVVVALENDVDDVFRGKLVTHL